MENKPFDHGYQNPISEKSMSEILGYIKCLRDLYNHVKDETQFNPDKRFIDSVTILDKITATSGELEAIFEKERTLLDEMATKILSATKQ